MIFLLLAVKLKDCSLKLFDKRPVHFKIFRLQLLKKLKIWRFFLINEKVIRTFQEIL